ncbi:actinia tenebrosa protease inhibitors-like [Pituophis catenifer annectens]|uniref:actinia tenebrosa protease inhibitors-like n=1 Tax=Pituophis catenifer annectens TaxID=94852 RepID=UPI003993D676
MWARVLFLGVLLSFSADLDAAGYDGGQKSQNPLNNDCDLPEVKGPCDNLELRWFHNSKSKRCERFFYGGCYGNANNYKEINECERCCVSPDVNKPGRCPVIIPNSHLLCGKLCSSDASCSGTQRCCPTSCGQQCQRPEGDTSGYCPWMIPPPSSKGGPLCFTSCTRDQECSIDFPLPQKKCCPFGDRKICVEAVEEHPGVCPRRVEVQTFVPCNNTCSDDRDCPLTEKCCFTGCSRGCLPSVRSDQCQLPVDQGSCSKELQRYYYDPEMMKCISFVYCGCEGNDNNFETKELCEKACGKISKEVCKLPADPGHCLAYSPQYFYNWEKRKCETFVYGMCGGNDNRFSTKLECEMVCGEFGQMQSPKA